jgi:signal transduction histidine kinase/CheY-like chemotaxis protein
MASSKGRDQEQIAALSRELGESLEQQAATSEILHIISSSPNDAQRVFDTIAKSAARLCGAQFCHVFRFDGELVHFAAEHGLAPEGVAAIRRAYPVPPGRASAAARAIISGAIAEIPDVHADPDYAHGGFAKVMNFRSIVAVPMMREERPIGAIAMARSQTGYFPDRQIQLLRTFADQAVIAIGNVRYIEEIEEKSRRLEIANTYKSRFLAAASHDLRQPLHALNLFVGQLRTEADSAERNHLVAGIDAAVSSMNELFDVLLDMSKLDAGILEKNQTDFPVEHLLKRMETTFAKAAREKGLRLRVLPSPAWVHSDFILLERILLNLVSNAVRYTARGGVVVGCRRRRQTWRIEVWDSGIGIPEDQQSDIFREFYQLDSGKPDRRAGLGLGLSIVDRLCQLLGITIEVASRPGTGSRFAIMVPAAAPQEVGPNVPIPVAVPDPINGRLIVVIDDDGLVLDGMRGTLRSWGCDVVTAGSDAAVLASLADQDRRPDLIISDFRLANGNTGIEVIERLRRSLGAAIPAFLISGDTGPERLREASASGHLLLHKPVAPMALRTTVNRLLKANSPARRIGETV